MTVLLRGPIGFDPAQKLQATIELATSGGDRETVTVAAAAAGSFELRGSVPTAEGAAKPGDGTLQVKAGERVTAAYGFGFLGRSASVTVEAP